MQLPPNVDFWLRVAAIVVPAISAIVVAVVSYRLSRRMANHQKDLNKELEGYKHELQTSFQTRFYEFQTRYSLLHQKKAEAIEKLFALLARVDNDLLYWLWSSHHLRNQTEEELYTQAEANLQELINFFDERKIYFEQGTTDMVLVIVDTVTMIYNEYPKVMQVKEAAPQLVYPIKQKADLLREKHIVPLMKLLEKRF